MTDHAAHPEHVDATHWEVRDPPYPRLARTGYWRVVDAAAEPCAANQYGLIADGFATRDAAQQYVTEAKERWRRAQPSNEMPPEISDP